MIYPQHDRVSKVSPAPSSQVMELSLPVASVSVARVRPRTSEGHHRPVIASLPSALGE